MILISHLQKDVSAQQKKGALVFGLYYNILVT